MSPIKLANENYKKLQKILKKEHFTIRDYQEVKGILVKAKDGMEEDNPKLVKTFYGYKVDAKEFLIKYYVVDSEITAVVVYVKNTGFTYRLTLDDEEETLEMDKYEYKIIE